MNLKNKTIVITAGPTREVIDPVRYISNYSSGKMGYNLALSAIRFGAQVVLISGPCCLPVPDGLSEFIAINSAEEMLIASEKYAINADVFIACAAVCDYRPKQIMAQKIKKTIDNEVFILEMIKNPDIIATIKQLHPDLFVVGFAAETENLVEYAQKKLISKNLDMIVANNVANGNGFGTEQNQVTVLARDGEFVTFELQDKSSLANKLIQYIANNII